MRTFAWTSLTRVIIILASWVYMTNFQSDTLYKFLNLNNPTSIAVSHCLDELKTLHSGHNAQLEVLQQKLDMILSGHEAPRPILSVSQINNTGSIVGATGTVSTGTAVALTGESLTGTTLKLNTEQ